MLKRVLWIAAACAAILLALAVSRMLNFDEPVKKRADVPVVVEAAPPPLTPDEQQIQDDAAATGMTTVEPEAPPQN